jgi:peroxiredoxin Q/BCP
VKSHQKFKRAYDLPFTLVADTDHAIADAYGVWVEKSMFGRRYFGNERTTFVIDRKGRIAKIFRTVKSEGHAEQVARAVEDMGA